MCSVIKTTPLFISLSCCIAVSLCIGSCVSRQRLRLLCFCNSVSPESRRRRLTSSVLPPSFMVVSAMFLVCFSSAVCLRLLSWRLSFSCSQLCVLLLCSLCAVRSKPTRCTYRAHCSLGVMAAMAFPKGNALDSAVVVGSVATSCCNLLVQNLRKTVRVAPPPFLPYA